MKILEYVNLSLPLAIASSYDAIWRDLNARLRAEGCNFLEAVILIALFFESRGTGGPATEVTPSRLAEVLGTSRGNVSHCLSRLERRRLIRRVLGERDARTYRLVPRPEGRRVACRLIRVLDEVEAIFEERIGRQGVLSAIEELRNVKRIYAESGSLTAPRKHRDQPAALTRISVPCNGDLRD